MSTPLMGLILPEENAAADIWDTLLNAALTRVDGHDHTTGLGAAIPSAGIELDADLPINGFALTGAKAITLTPISSAAMSAYDNALYVATSGDLYLRNGGGADVRITAGGVLNVASLAGGIGGDYTAAGALFSFDDANDRYLAQQQGSPRPWAGVAMGRLDLYEQAPSIANRVRLRSPNALAASYEVVFPGAVPGVAGFVQMSTAGVLSVSNALPAGESVTLSGGGRYKHGSKTVAFGLDRSSFVGESGGAAGWTYGSKGTSLTASADTRFALPQLSPDAEIIAIRVYCTGASGQLTAALEWFDPSSGYISVVSAASDAAVPRKATVTPASPFLIGAKVLGVRITTTGTGAGTVTTCQVDYQVT